MEKLFNRGICHALESEAVASLERRLAEAERWREIDTYMHTMNKETDLVVEKQKITECARLPLFDTTRSLLSYKYSPNGHGHISFGPAHLLFVQPDKSSLSRRLLFCCSPDNPSWVCNQRVSLTKSEVFSLLDIIATLYQNAEQNPERGETLLELAKFREAIGSDGDCPKM